jgi:hypothetical protein
MTEKIDYLKIGKATDLTGRDRKIYRVLEILPGVFSLATLIILVVWSYFKPVWVAYIIIAFDVYWLLLVFYMAIFLISSYFRLKAGSETNWRQKCSELLNPAVAVTFPETALCRAGLKYADVCQLVILPIYQESEEIISECLDALVADGFPSKQMIVALTFEERAGLEGAKRRAAYVAQNYSGKFGHLFITFHPEGIIGELKGKGANQAWCAQKIKEEIIDPEGLDYEKILVSVFDIDTVVSPGYFFAVTYKFLTVADPYRTSYQPVPVYHNNIWSSPFFSRVTASSNTFWQMIMQIRQESLVTYSSHSMTFRALNEIGFWGTKNVSEDSRIFWHCLMYYNGHYRVEPIYFKVSMDVTADKGFWQTAKNLYKQQRRWAWGGENIPYLLFNAWKRWRNRDFDKAKITEHIIIQIYGFHAWATNALIIGVIGWLPMLLGGDRFNSTVLSGNLPFVTQKLMSFAMIGMVLSAIISYLLLPKRPKKYKPFKKIWMTLEWLTVPVTIIIFGAIPCLEAQIRLLLGKYMGYWVTPKSR